MHAIALALEIRKDVNTHPLLSKYFRILSPAEMIPANPGRRFHQLHGPRRHLDPGTTLRSSRTSSCWTRRGSRSSAVRPDTTARSSRGCSQSEYGIQLNKTSRNSVLLQTNINNTRSDVANLLRVLVAIARKIDDGLRQGGDDARKAFAEERQVADGGRTGAAQLQSFPRPLPHRSVRVRHSRATCARRFTWPTAKKFCEHLELDSPEVDRRLESGATNGIGELRDPVPTGLSDHGAGPADRSGHHRVHAQA